MHCFEHPLGILKPFIPLCEQDGARGHHAFLLECVGCLHGRVRVRADRTDQRVVSGRRWHHRLALDPLKDLQGLLWKRAFVACTNQDVVGTSVGQKDPWLH